MLYTLGACVRGQRIRVWEVCGPDAGGFFFSPPKRHEDESPSRHMVWLSATVPLCWAVRIFFLNPVGICFLLMNTTAEWLAQIKPTDRVCLDLLIKKLEMQDARFC